MKLIIKKYSSQYILILGLLFSIFLLPSYFAIDFNDTLPMFSIQRVIAIIAIISCCFDSRRFAKSLSRIRVLILILFYIFTTYISALVNGSIIDKSWLGIILEQVIILYLYIYFIHYHSSIEQILKMFRICAVILCILGLLEYLNGESFYSALETTSREIWTGNFIRGGSHRIMGPFNHALAFGLVLSVLFPICCYDEEKKKINIAKRWWLIILLVINVFLTGSRSTIVIILMELFLIFLASGNKNKFKMTVGGGIALVGACVYITTSNSIVALNIKIILTSLSDMLFRTNLTTIEVYSAELGLRQRLGFLKLFLSKEINPIIGNGFNYNVGHSVDNNYVLLYMRTGWLGLIGFVFIVSYITLYVFSHIKTNRVRVLTISVVGYCVHLLFVAELHTISILFMILGVLYCEQYDIKNEKLQT